MALNASMSWLRMLSLEEKKTKRSEYSPLRVGARSEKHLFRESCVQKDWTDVYAKSQAFDSEHRA